MRVLVTGSSGYIGSRLAGRLKAEGYTVVGVDRKRDEAGRLDRFVHGDLAEAETRRAALKNVDLILHLAAAKDDWGIDDETFHFENYEVTRRLLADANERGIRRWFFYSSVAAIGPSDEPLDEEAPLTPNEAYGVSKARAEALFREKVEGERDFSCTILRPSIVFGPGNFHYTNVYRLIEAIRTHQFLMVGDGGAIKTTSYIENVVEATLFLMRQMTSGMQTYNYVDWPVRPTADLVSDIYRILGKRQPRIRVPVGLAKALTYGVDWVAEWTGINFPITAARIEKFNTSTNYDASALRKVGFEQPVDIETALHRTIEWHLRHVEDTIRIGN